MTILARELAELIASSPEGFAPAMDRVRHWTREGLLNLVGDQNPGRGKKRFYDEKSMIFARILNAMANAGLDLNKAKTLTSENTVQSILDGIWMLRESILKKDDYNYYITIHYGPKYGIKGEAIIDMPRGMLRELTYIGDDTEMAIVLNLTRILA